MVKTGAPKRVWDHCNELEVLIQLHTALDIFALQGQVPKTLMSGQAADTSSICENEWFQWVMYMSPIVCHLRVLWTSQELINSLYLF